MGVKAGGWEGGSSPPKSNTTQCTDQNDQKVRTQTNNHNQYPKIMPSESDGGSVGVCSLALKQQEHLIGSGGSETQWGGLGGGGIPANE